jgi:SNF2 family DNA or RNA helicase
MDYKANKAGLAIVKADGIKDVFYDQEEKKFEVKINYGVQCIVTIFYQSAFKLKSVTCSISTDNDQFITAALHYLVGKSDSDINVVRDLSLQRKNSENQDIVTKDDILEMVFDLQDPSEYREIPSNALKDLQLFLQVHKQDNSFFSSFYIDVDCEVLPNNNIKAKLYNTYELDKEGGRKLVTTVKIKRKEDGSIFIKNTGSATPSTKLTQYQYFLLAKYFSLDALKNILTTSYTDLYKSFTTQSKLSVEKFQKLFAVKVDKNNFVVDQKIKNYYSAETLNMTSSVLVKAQTIAHEQLLTILQKDGKKDSEYWKNALVWSPTDPLPQLIEGRASKSSEKISSSMKITPKAQYYDTQQKEMLDQMTYLIEKYHYAPKVRNRAVLSFVKKNLDLFSSLNHFLTDEATGLRRTEMEAMYVRNEIASVVYSVDMDVDFIYVKSSIKIQDITIMEPYEVFPYFLVKDNNAFVFDNEFQSELVTNKALRDFVIDVDDLPQAKELFLNIMQHCEVDLPPDFEMMVDECSLGAKELFITEVDKYLIFQPRLRYDDELVFKILEENYHRNEAEGKDATIYQVNEDERNEFINFLIQQNQHFKSSYEETGSFVIHVSNLLKDTWFLKFFEECRRQEIGIYGQEKLTNFRFNTNSAYITTSISSGIDWFDVQVDISYGDQKVNYTSWLKAVKNNEKYIKLDDGSYGIIPEEWYEKLRNIAKVVEVEDGGLKLNKYKFGVVDQLFEEMSDELLYQDIKYRINALKNFEQDDTKEVIIPDAIDATLRPYQLEGYRWLSKLDELGFGGCLADDMGLGKTLQVIMLLALQKEKNNGVSLVIVPRSLLFNWAAELEKFCPELSFFSYHGSNRMEFRKNLTDHDLIITTYDTATIDIEFFREIKFNYIILDESQAIKNPNSKRYKAMRLLNARNRLVMTGTPLENNTFDLYSQFSFINPGIFGGQNSFKERFSDPIDKNGDEASAAMLRRIISPFFLRRTKELVAKDLPEKSENIMYCEMGVHQRSLYEALKKQIRDDIEGTITINGLAKSKFKILEGLLRLRQVCNSPALIDKTLPAHKQASVKIQTLLEVIENDLGSHNALIFSQFTTMLDLIRKELDKKGIKYAYLDGQTRDRKGAVEDFQNNDDVQIFLISLKAGNTGLNLVKADYVYIVDPWWNPAVEAQAIDRTHRIGQDKHIFAYKMVCKDTIEEKILELQAKKKKIAEDIVVTEENFIKSLDKGALLDLFN